MKSMFCFIVVLIVAFISGPCLAQVVPDARPFLREESEVYLQAYLQRDYDTCLKMMGGDIVRALGGKIAVLNDYHATEAALKLRNMQLETIIVGDPGQVVSSGAEDQFVVIPEKHYYSGKDGKYVLNSYILAVSEDGGRTWNLLEGSWRLSEHIKNKDLLLYDRLKLPVRKIYFADDPKIMMLEKGGGFITPPETIKYKRSLRQQPAQPARTTSY